MAALQKPKENDVRRYTYSDYLEWDDDTRWELIDGIPYAMAAPLISHQSASTNITVQIGQFLRGKSCKVSHSPTDVRLNADKLDNTVVQPDLLVVCDKTKLDDGKAVNGAPDMTVEVLSPSSASHDMVRKFGLYLKAGVREYWIVDPVTKSIIVNVLSEGTYISKAYSETDKVPISALEGCVVDLQEVFA